MVALENTPAIGHLEFRGTWAVSLQPLSWVMTWHCIYGPSFSLSLSGKVKVVTKKRSLELYGTRLQAGKRAAVGVGTMSFFVLKVQ